ncbi:MULTISPECIES: hypothetical protein [unclassified Nostoc]|nr:MULTISPECIES: hypothetical protein [unclassified Nostoc]
MIVSELVYLRVRIGLKLEETLQNWELSQRQDLEFAIAITIY